MLKLFSISKSLRSPIINIVNRNILSQSYQCEALWNDRRKFLPIEYDRKYLLTTIHNDLMKDVPVSPLDMDILMCYLNEFDHTYHNMISDIIFKFRQSQESLKTLNSTSHTIIRSLCENNEIDFVYGILRDRVKNGVFIDEVSINWLLDAYINLQTKQWEEASFIAAEWIFQEDFHLSPLGMCLSLRVLSEYLRTDEWLKSESHQDISPKGKSDEEVEYKFWKFLPPNSFDNHFDLLCSKHVQRMCGKCLEILSDNMETILMSQTDVAFSPDQVDYLKYNLKLFGLVLHLKLNEAVDFLDNWLQNKTVKISNSLILPILNIIRNAERKIESEDEDLIQKYPVYTDSEIEILLERFNDLKGQMEQKDIVQLEEKEDFLSHVIEITSNIQSTLMENEVKIVEDLYTGFNKIRSDVFEETKQMKLLEKKIQESKDKLKDLQEEEELIRSFEKMPEILYNNWLAARVKGEKYSSLKWHKENVSNLARYEKKKFVIQHESD